MNKATALDKDRQIESIIRWIATNGQPTKEQMKRWASKWCVGLDTVGHYLSEALRVIRLSYGEPAWKDMLAEKLLQLDKVRRVAMRQKRQVVVEGCVQEYPNPDCKAAVRAIEVQLHATGHMVRKDGKRKHPEGSLADLQQKRDAVRVALGELEAVIEAKAAAEVH